MSVTANGKGADLSVFLILRLSILCQEGLVAMEIGERW